MTNDILTILNSDRTNTILSHLSSQRRLGWEKWIQFELAYALTQYGTPEVEVRFPYDLRCNVAQRHAENRNGSIDIVFRKNKQARNLFAAVEIKLGKSDKIIRALLADLLKIAACTNSEWQYRSVIALGIVLGEGVRATKFSLATTALIESGYLMVERIVNTDFKMLVLKWEATPRNSNRDNFRDWLLKIESIMNENSVHVKKNKRSLTAT